MAVRRRGRSGAAARAAAGILTAASLLVACAPANHSVRPVGESTASTPARTDLSVYAAASLEPGFEQLRETFAATHPEITITFTYDGSSVLATQIVNGAPADVFASADEATMAVLTRASLTDGDPVRFASSELVIAVAKGNPLGITSLADLAKPLPADTPPTVVLCAPEVPCGAAARTLLTRNEVRLTPASEEQNVTAVLTRVRSGEADAGLVYASDVQRAAREVSGVSIAGSAEAAGSYLAVPVAGTPHAAAARAFVTFLTSQEAQELLTDLGFGTS
ncbi:molybdate ABC transporter substrate-binding protein [Leucobacter insecticola]|uniref:Molybdate ABC transporter substrate-binding protein n=1 Tax=Leucobacter insecticola TaxID=2714934 RepID=A0A6G8FKU3_9MICO|nr:molybdate ABC transporter substrate-binding protein [Leucobacter insecticola]QIM16987.1 molybdate ABC transporter substrate-binding protein [Leucobacter insecticola]